MKRVLAERHPTDVGALKLRPASAEDFDVCIDESTIVEEDGKPCIVYEVFDGDLTELIWAVQNIKYSKNFRSGGLPTVSRIFGYRPRTEVRANLETCSTTSLARESPRQHAVICDFAVLMTESYRKYSAGAYEIHAATMSGVLPEWCIPDSLYTSGIVNKNNALRYHHDTGNFKDCWSGMIVLPNRVRGGELVVPEFRLAFDFRRPAIIFFDGQSLLHGVMPIEVPAGIGYRYSIVYYSLQKMCRCLTVGEESEHGRVWRTRAEHRRLAYSKGESDPAQESKKTQERKRAKE